MCGYSCFWFDFHIYILLAAHVASSNVEAVWQHSSSFEFYVPKRVTFLIKVVQFSNQVRTSLHARGALPKGQHFFQISSSHHHPFQSNYPTMSAQRNLNLLTSDFSYIPNAIWHKVRDENIVLLHAKKFRWNIWTPWQCDSLHKNALSVAYPWHRIPSQSLSLTIIPALISIDSSIKKHKTCCKRRHRNEDAVPV